MKIFPNLNELQNFLRRDKGRQSFNPVRFINVESFNELFDMKIFLGSLTTNWIYLSDYCGEDTFPNLRKLRNDLRQETRNVSVLPLSELLRVNPDQAANEVNRFLDLYGGETYSFRIYFLMYRLRNFFLSLKIPDLRKEDCLLLTETTSTDKYSLTLIQKSMRVNLDGEHVEGFKQYLQSWEKSESPSPILFTDKAAYLQNVKFFDNVKVIANAFDLLRHHYDLPAEFKRDFGRDEDWKRLVGLIEASGDFERAFCNEFRVDGFGANVFKNFGEREKFKRWLLWLRCKVQSFGYASICAAASSSPEEFAEQLYEQIFSCADKKNFDELCRERREILSTAKLRPSENFLERVRRADKLIALKILTCSSHAEQLLIFDVLKKFKFDEFDAARAILSEIFPALAKYLSDAGDETFSAEQAEYFRRYRWLKVTNQITEEFNRRVTEIVGVENIFSTTPRNQIVREEYSESAGIFFADGLGAEYLNFLAEDFATLAENFAVKCRVGRCDLPSVTELNKDFLQGRNVAAELSEPDILKHESRTYPENILCELTFLATLKEKILRALDNFKKIILCSDHGASRLAVLARQKEFVKAFPSEGRQVYKSGRFADANSGDEKIFPNALEYDGKIIFADYSRFVQKGSTGNEIHGGATLEEILVPVITIERSANR